jgi:Trp operon repressor
MLICGHSHAVETLTEQKILSLFNLFLTKRKRRFLINRVAMETQTVDDPTGKRVFIMKVPKHVASIIRSDYTQ